MKKATVAAMMRARATELRVSSLDGGKRQTLTPTQCANILLEYVKLLEEGDSLLSPPFKAGDFPEPWRVHLGGDAPAQRNGPRSFA